MAAALRAEGDSVELTLADTKLKRALADAKASVDANLKAIAAADQENATKRDQRAASARARPAGARSAATEQH